MRLIEQFNQLQTRDEKREFALQHVTDEHHIELLSYDKISLFTITALFYKSQGEQYNVKRNYTPTFKTHKTL